VSWGGGQKEKPTFGRPYLRFSGGKKKQARPKQTKGGQKKAKLPEKNSEEKKRNRMTNKSRGKEKKKDLSCPSGK